MEGFGIVLQSIGAILIMYSQFEMSRTASMWLRTLDMTVDQLASNATDIVRVRGLDQHWEGDLKRDKWLSLFGWLFFVGGYFLLIWQILNAKGG
jgi:hypothetical protein